jgi:DNA-binding IclR family transcriptional regulator
VDGFHEDEPEGEADEGTTPLGEISRRLGLPKSAAHRLLTNLCNLGWAEQDRDGDFA